MTTKPLPVLRPFDGPTIHGFPRYRLCASCEAEILARSARETRCVRCRLYASIDVRAPNECWPWRGSTSGGYGMFLRDGRMVPAHRAAWEIENGATIPPHLVARHSCDVPLCANHHHVEPGTESQNVEDAIQRGRRPRTPVAALRARGVLA